MLLVISKDPKILHLVSIHEFRYGDDFDFLDWGDSEMDVGQLLGLDVGGSNIDGSLERANVFELY